MTCDGKADDCGMSACVLAGNEVGLIGVLGRERPAAGLELDQRQIPARSALDQLVAVAPQLDTRAPAAGRPAWMLRHDQASTCAIAELACCSRSRSPRVAAARVDGPASACGSAPGRRPAWPPKVVRASTSAPGRNRVVIRRADRPRLERERARAGSLPRCLRPLVASPAGEPGLPNRRLGAGGSRGRLRGGRRGAAGRSGRRCRRLGQRATRAFGAAPSRCRCSARASSDRELSVARAPLPGRHVVRARPQ